MSERIAYPRAGRGFIWKGATIQCQTCAAGDRAAAGGSLPWGTGGVSAVCDDSRAEQWRLIRLMGPPQLAQYAREMACGDDPAVFASKLAYVLKTERLGAAAAAKAAKAAA